MADPTDDERRRALKRPPPGTPSALLWDAADDARAAGYPDTANGLQMESLLLFDDPWGRDPSVISAARSLAEKALRARQIADYWQRAADAMQALIDAAPLEPPPRPAPPAKKRTPRKLAR